MSDSRPALGPRASSASSRASSDQSVPRIALEASHSPQLQAALKHPVHPAREVHSASSASLIPPLKSALKQPHFELQDEPHSPAMSGSATIDSMISSPGAISAVLSSAPTTSSYVPRGDESPTQPPRTSFKVGVAFDIMDDEPRRTGGGTGLDYSFTLRARSTDYERTKQSRQFLVCTDGNDYSNNALDWALENLAEDGDEVVILKVLEPKSDATQKDADDAKAEAQAVMDSIMAKHAEARSISVVVEFVVGPLHNSMQRMIQLYRPDSLIVGTRGRSETIWRSAFIGSTSRYALERSPIPVIVVRPQRKVRKSLEARQNDPKRRSYAALVEDKQGKDDEGLMLRPTQTMPLPTEKDERRSRSPSRLGGNSDKRTSSLDRGIAIKFADLPTPSKTN